MIEWSNMSEKLTIADFVRKLQENGFNITDATLYRHVIEILDNLDLDVEDWFNIYNNVKSERIKRIAREKILKKLKTVQ